tara:strand:- start:6610 stop:7104 length:495 start_codon:yes stop_codon:yes gene_type:complete
MPKNSKGGSKHKKMKNSTTDVLTKKDLILAEEGQGYGRVEALLGNCRVRLLCNDKETRLGIIRGSMKKRQWLSLGSVVIYSGRGYQDDKVDIFHVYSGDALKTLKDKMNLTFNSSNVTYTENILIDDEDDDIFGVDSDEVDEIITEEDYNKREKEELYKIIDDI